MTARVAEVRGWGAAVKGLDQFDMRERHDQMNDVAAGTAARMREIPGIRIYGHPQRGPYILIPGISLIRAAVQEATSLI